MVFFYQIKYFLCLNVAFSYQVNNQVNYKVLFYFIRLTTFFAWVLSLAVAAPIVLGVNQRPNNNDNSCSFYNSDFIIVSSLLSFYLPLVFMLFIYWNVFKVGFFLGAPTHLCL